MASHLLILWGGGKYALAVKGKSILWARSSAGRAPRLHRGGHRFDPVRVHSFSMAAFLKKLRQKILYIFRENGSEPIKV